MADIPISSLPGMPIQNPSLFSLPQNIVELLLDPSLVIERVRRDLRGEILIRKYIKDTDDVLQPVDVWEKKGARVMNDEGIEMVVSILNGYVNRNSIFSNLTEDEIYKIILQLDWNLNALFYAKGTKFDMDRNMKAIVKDKIVDMCFFALKQSQNRALMEALTKLWTVHEDRSQPQKGGGISDTVMSYISPINRGGQ